MTDHLRTLAALSRFPAVCIPNAGLPDEEGHYNESPEMIAAKLERFVDAGWLNMLGGCCGTTPAHIELLRHMLEGKRPRTLPTTKRSVVSGLEPLVIDDDKRPVLVGERTNVIGSRKFKRLLTEGAFEEGAEIGRRQVRGGAQIVDVCVADPDREELSDMTAFLDILVRKIKVPLMIDSTDARVIEAALEQSQGKAIVNSINLETARNGLRRSCRSSNATARRWLWAVLMKTRNRAWRSPGSENSQLRNGAMRCSPTKRPVG